MELNPYLLFGGDCATAFKFYEQLLGGKGLMMMTHRESPAAQHTSPEWQDKIIHARMLVGEYTLMGSDAPPGHFNKPQGFSVSIQIDDPAEGERIFNALAENGNVMMSYAQTFWSRGFGMCVDQFGIPWMVNCEQEP